MNITSEITEGPRQVEALLNNMRLYAADITPILMGISGKESTRSATIDFGITNFLQKKAVERLLKEDTKAKIISAGASDRTGGVLDIWARSSLGNRNAPLNLYYGFEITVDSPKALDVDLYAQLLSPEIYSNSAGGWDERFGACRTIWKNHFSKLGKAEIEEAFILAIREAASVTLKSKVFKDKGRLQTLGRLKKMRQ